MTLASASALASVGNDSSSSIKSSKSSSSRSRSKQKHANQQQVQDRNKQTTTAPGRPRVDGCRTASPPNQRGWQTHSVCTMFRTNELLLRLEPCRPLSPLANDSRKRPFCAAICSRTTIRRSIMIIVITPRPSTTLL